MIVRLDTYSPKVQVTHISHWNERGIGDAFPIENVDKASKLRKQCRKTDSTKLIFNAKFDLRMLTKEGIKLKGPVIDVLLMAQMLLPDEKGKGLKQLVRKFLLEPFIEEVRLMAWLKANKLTKKDMSKAPRHIIEPYALADARQCFELFVYLSTAMDEYHMWHVLEREMILMQIGVMPMEDEGVNLNESKVSDLQIKTRDALKIIKTQMSELTGSATFNPNSTTQVRDELSKEGVWQPTRFSKKTGAPMTDVIALMEYPSDLGALIMKYRKVSKAATTYLRNFKGKKIRVSFNQGGARTGRFSSSGPNLQNIPRPSDDNLLGSIRECFIADRLCRLLFIDYDQIEMRLTAHFSGEEHMLQAINDGVDLHDVTTRKVFNTKKSSIKWKLMRYLAKTLNFSVIYGTGPEVFRTTVLKQTSGEIRITLYEAARYLNEWKEQHPSVMGLFDSTAMEVATTGGIRNHYGRYIPVANGKAYVAVNYKVQGSAADFMKLKMFEVIDFLRGTDIKMLMTVHDELGFNLPKHEAHRVQDLLSLMEDHTSFNVPLTASGGYGRNWANKKDIIRAA